MAVAFGASGRYLRRTANLPSSTAFTVAAWVYWATIRNTYSYVFELGDATTNAGTYCVLGHSNATTMEISTGSSFGTFGTNVTAATWNFAAITCSGTGGTDFKGYWRSLAATSFVSVSATGPSFTPAVLYIGNDSYDEWTDTRIGPVYVFGRVLTEAELWQLSQSIRPNVIGAMPSLWSPLWSASDVADYSGNGYNWTVGGTLSNSDGPPVSWGVRPWLLPFVVAASGTTYNQSAAGTLTPAGAQVRRTNKVVVGALTTAGVVTRRIAKSLTGALTTAGAVTKRAAKSLAGTLTPAGALATIRLYVAAVGGTLTPAGATVKRTAKGLAGVLTPAGGLSRRIAKSLAGTLTSAGVLSTIRLYVAAVGGTLTTAGAVTKRAAKSLAGTLTAAGAITRRTAKSLAGALTTAGAVIAAFISGSATYSQAVGGTLTTAGTLARSTAKSLAGTLTAAGAITRRTAKSLAGALTTAGALLRQWVSPSAAKLDVTLADALAYTCTLADALAYTCTLVDAPAYTCTLEDATV